MKKSESEPVLQICGASIAAGERRFVWLNIDKLTDGAPLRIPVHVVRGRTGGPTLCLVAGVHGDETLGVEVLERIFTEVTPKNLQGSLIVVPVANPLGIQSGSRNVPLDMLDMNRNFPGNPHGWLTEQMTSALIDEVVRKSDILIDFHAAPPFERVNYTYISQAGVKADAEAERLGVLFGQKLIYKSPGHPGAISNVSLTLGLPAFTTEFGAHVQSENHGDSEIVVRGVHNVMSDRGMIRGRVGRRKTQYVFGPEDYRVLRPRHGGLLRPSLPTRMQGEEVKRGTILGAAFSPYTFETLETFKAPFPMTSLILLRDRSVLRPGDYTYIVGNFAKARRLENGHSAQ